ncbi:MAG: hypothetical protein J7L99_07515 [Planctomycetes bacterium]|nr:hypothetical protein [Planctomycetota bacterium]
MNFRYLYTIIPIITAVFIAGCRKPCPEKFVSLDRLVKEYNLNAEKVKTLWSRVRLRITITDEKGRSISWGSTSPLAVPNGLLCLEKLPADSSRSYPPDQKDRQINFVLIGREISELFRVGIDAKNGLYYLWFDVGKSAGAWFGRCKYAGAPNVRAMPIDPMQLVEILSITMLPSPEPNTLPAVVMTLENDPCAYVVRYLAPQPITGHLKIWREVYFKWSDTEPRRPFRIKIYDTSGLCRVVADVKDYKPIRQGWEYPQNAPVIPTDIHITWPAIPNIQPASSIHMKLSEMTLQKRFNSKVFDFFSHLPSQITEPILIDEGIEELRDKASLHGHNY